MSSMNLKQALERIEQLEKRIKELESRPEQHIHYHTHPSVAPLSPYWPAAPSYPSQPTYDPFRWIPPPTITC